MEFLEFLKSQIKAETQLDRLHFNSWTQIQKRSFLGLEFRFRERSTNCQNTLHGDDPYFRNQHFSKNIAIIIH